MTLLLLASAGCAAEEGSITVAVIDTGISTAAVSSERILPGQNYILPQEDTQDKLGHGTAVSAIIVGSEAAQVTAICPEALLVPLVTTSKQEDGTQISGDTALVAQAICDAVDRYNCRIINISSGAAQDGDALRSAVNYAAEKGALIISCAGNNQQLRPGALCYPGAYPSVLCVGAANDDGSVASFSQQNDAVDLLAPGTMRVATIKGTRIRASGTSYATAIVSGAAAHIWNKYPTLTADEVRAAILTSAREVNGWPVFDLEVALGWEHKAT